MSMEVNRRVGSLRFLVLGLSTSFVLLSLMVKHLGKSIMKYYFQIKNVSIHSDNSTLELLQKGNFTVVAVIAASIKS